MVGCTSQGLHACRLLRKQGLKCGILCEMLNTGLGFWAYEMGQGLFRDLHEGRSPSPRERGFIGGFSAMLVMSTTMPLETVLRRLQVSPIISRFSISHDTKPQAGSGTSIGPRLLSHADMSQLDGCAGPRPPREAFALPQRPSLLKHDPASGGLPRPVSRPG